MIPRARREKRERPDDSLSVRFFDRGYVHLARNQRSGPAKVETNDEQLPRSDAPRYKLAPRCYKSAVRREGLVVFTPSREPAPGTEDDRSLEHSMPSVRYK